MKIAFVVQGLFEKSDSIGFDCVYEYTRIKRAFKGKAADIRIYAERFDLDRHPDIPIEGLDAFYAWCKANRDGTIIYHYCGAWREMDDFLVDRPTTSVIRWHNNTSPWFYFDKEAYLVHTIEGFDNIVRICNKPNLRFWVNSAFTQQQFTALGGQSSRSDVVFPASRYLQKPVTTRPAHRRFPVSGAISLLFVGRVVHHKGHKSIISVARRVHDLTGRQVIVRFAGREDSVKDDIVRYGQDVPGVETHFYGEVSEEQLEELYRISDAFLCLSEHEGFGLPVFEAMRCSLPTIVWSTTALRELMEKHPFGFHYYDLNMFAAAVVSLQDEDVYERVLKAQDRVLQVYTVEIVDRQLLRALDHLRQRPEREGLAGAHPALRDEAEITTIMARKLSAIRPGGDVTEAVDRDSGYNLFSRYDVQMFRQMLDRTNRLRFADLESYDAGGRYLVPGMEFHSHVGKRDGQTMMFPHGPYESGHLIFGPYIALPPGRYTAEFDLVAALPPGGDVQFDVTARKQGGLGQKSIKMRSINDGPLSLRFRNDDPDDILEFRVKFGRPFTGEIIFRGVWLSQSF